MGDDISTKKQLMGLDGHIAILLSSFYPYSPKSILEEYNDVRSWDKIIAAIEYAREKGISPAYRLARVVEIMEGRLLADES